MRWRKQPHAIRYDAAVAECNGRVVMVGGNAAAAWLPDGRPARMAPTAEAWALVPAGDSARGGGEASGGEAGGRWVRLVTDLLPGPSGWRAEPGPSARRGAAAASLGGGLVAMHGGVSGEEAYEVPSDELWLLGCPAEGAAVWRHQSAPDTRRPTARAFHSATQLPTAAAGAVELLVYGGRAPLGGAAAFAAGVAADRAASDALARMARGDADAAAAAAAAAAASRLEEVAEQGRRRVLGDLWLLERSGA